MSYDFENLDVWKKSLSFVEEIYKFTASFPKEERYGLVSQMQRSAVSIPSNISEGSQRSSTKDFSYFLTVALGSTAELQTQIIISARLGLSSEDKISHLLSDLVDIRKMIVKLRKYLNS